MDGINGVMLKELVKEFDLEILHEGDGYEDVRIKTENVNRPALQLTGFMDYFDFDRIQVMGRVEMTYMLQLSYEERMERFEALFSHKIPALIYSRGMDPLPECMEMAQKYGRTILRSQDTTTVLLGAIGTFLENYLAPCITRHGVLLDVYGEGILLVGESGVGKSETAIELVKRGHRLIADDAVEIRRTTSKQLFGTAPELIRYYIEIRGIGVIDVPSLFGMSAVMKESQIDLVINLEQWRDGGNYDRLGVEEQTTTFLDVAVPSITVPVKPGRNLAVIIEVAAMNNRHKKMGHNAALEFTQRLDKHFEAVMNGNA